MKPATYYYHPDHLGSTSWLTDQNGRVHEHVEYFPYGDVWRETRGDDDPGPKPRIPSYLFTGKEFDEETGLTYFGARYYDSNKARWLSVDPALDSYFPSANEDQKSLPGMGGGFNPRNLSLQAYAGQCPTFLQDHDGRTIVVQGSPEFVKSVMVMMQHLAPSAKIDSNGKVSVDRPKRGDVAGQLVFGLVNSSKTTTVIEYPYDDRARPSNAQDASNGKGSDSTVLIKPGHDPEIPILKTDGRVVNEKGQPEFIQLGHELIHALHHTKGTLPGKIAPNGKFKYDDANWTFTDSTGKFDITVTSYREELNAVGLGKYQDGPTENDLRKQFHLEPRGAYDNRVDK